MHIPFFVLYFCPAEAARACNAFSNRSLDGLWPKKTYVWVLFCDAPKGKERNGSMWQQTWSRDTVTSLSNLTFRCNFCHFQMYVQRILNSVFTNTSLCQHIYAKQIPSQKSSHHATLNLIITLVCTSSYLSQAQRETRENPSIIPQTRCFYTNQSPWPTIPWISHRWIQTKMLKQNQLEMKRKLRTSLRETRLRRFPVLKPQQGSVVPYVSRNKKCMETWHRSFL